MNGAMDVEDGAGLRNLLDQYRQEYPDDPNQLQEGYGIIADCLQHPGPTATAAGHRYFDRERGSILRRFVRSNIQHPTYKAFSELGRAVKTIFLCQYLHSEALRREINEGLNVVEQWNSANDFIFFARRGDMASNRREDHEISMLALHLRKRYGDPTWLFPG